MSELKTTQEQREYWKLITQHREPKVAAGITKRGLANLVDDLATLQQRVAELEAALAEAQAQNEGLEMRVRHLLWPNHGHKGTYGDDGEMQCAECAKYGVWDYKNAPIVEVEAAYRLAVMEIAARNPPAQEGEKP